MNGPWGNERRTNAKTFSVAEAHDAVAITATMYSLGTRDGEQSWIDVDGERRYSVTCHHSDWGNCAQNQGYENVLYSVTHDDAAMSSTTRSCLQAEDVNTHGEQHCVWTVEFILLHTAAEVTIEFWSDVDEDLNNEGWAFGDVSVEARSLDGPHVVKSSLTIGGLTLEAAESHAGVFVSAIASMASVAESRVSVALQTTTAAAAQFEWHIPNPANVGNVQDTPLDYESKKSYLIVPDFEAAMAPSDAITVAAWVTLDSPTEHQWGGIVSFIQDNGGYEKGFVLGYTSDGKFTWGVSDGSLNYLKATTAAAQAGVLHYVVGTYDSTTQKLYVDGELVATSGVLSGAIEYGGTETLAFGTFLDDTEEYQMSGTIDSVKIFDSALTAQQVRGAPDGEFLLGCGGSSAGTCVPAVTAASKK